MAVFDLFSKRQKRLRGDIPDVYQYETLPPNLTVQIVHILQDGLGKGDDLHHETVQNIYKFIVETLRREYGVFQLIDGVFRRGIEHPDELYNFFLKEESFEKKLDVVEFGFRCIDRLTREYSYARKSDFNEIANSSIAELNTRLREHGVGFQYENGELIRIDSQFIHAEVVKSALSLLNSKEFRGPQEEFLKAHEHYRHGRYKEALNDALKAFESTMKSICDKRKWSYKPNATSKELVDICMHNDLVPSFWQQNMAAPSSTLKCDYATLA